MEENQMKKEITIKIGADTTELDTAIEKANQLVALIEKAQTLINSLSD